MKQQTWLKCNRRVFGMMVGFLVPGVAFGGVIELLPVDSTAPGHKIVGNTMYLAPSEVAAGGVSATFEVWLSDWGPRLLIAWQANIPASGYDNGSGGGVLTPAQIPCADDDDCRAAFGGVCTNSGNLCDLDSDCPRFPAESCTSQTECGLPDGSSFCRPGYISESRADYVFREIDGYSGVDLQEHIFRYGAMIDDNASPGVPDHGPRYAGTLEISVPPDAQDTYRIELGEWSTLLDRSHTFMEAALIGAMVKIEDPPVVGACCWDDPLLGPGCSVTPQSLCEFPPPNSQVVFGTFKGDGTSCEGDSDGDGLDDVCSTCGNGTREAPEQCDGNDLGPLCSLGCLPDCTCMSLSPGRVRWFSMEGVATGMPFSWNLSGAGLSLVDTDAYLGSAGVGPAGMAAGFSASIDAQLGGMGFAFTDPADLSIFGVAVSGVSGFDLEVGVAGQAPDCVVTDAGCTFNPTIHAVREPVLSSIPAASTWGLAALALALLVGARVYFSRRQEANE